MPADKLWASRFRAGLCCTPVTISLNVPATMNVRADVSAMTVNSVHTIRKAIVPPKSMSIAVTQSDWMESKYGEIDRTFQSRSINSDNIATVMDMTAAKHHKSLSNTSQDLRQLVIHKYQKNL